MKLFIKAALKKADSKIEVYHRKDSKFDEEWFKKQLAMKRKVVSESGTDRYFSGESLEDIYDWYALDTPSENHKNLNLLSKRMK